MRDLHLDVETRSPVDLPRANAYVYFDHPDTALWCAAYAFGDEEPRLWWPGEPCPPEIAEHVRAGGLIKAWNAAFERLCWRELLGPRHGWPVPDLRQYRCVMAAAYALALPGKLDAAAPALGLDTVKDATGHRLMLKLSKPRRVEGDTLIWWDDPGMIARLGAYCQQDVRTEVAIDKRLLPLPPDEQETWFLDQVMNDRGVYIDEPLCLAGQTVVRDALHRLDQEMRLVTDAAVPRVSNAAGLVEWVNAQGVAVTSIAKEDLAALLLRDDLPKHVRRALEIRQEGSKTSTAKIGKLLGCRQADGRMRGNLQYHGATTGRWAARGAQLQNLPAPGAQGRRGADRRPRPRLGGSARDAARAGHGGRVRLHSRHGRGAPGHRIMAADYSQIEARVTAWLSGEATMLDAFRKADRKEGPDVYIVTATGIYRTRPGEITKDDPRRQVGKVGNLSLGFGGGAGALLRMAKAYRLDIADARDAVMASASDANVLKAEDAWEQRGKASGVAEHRWLTAELIKLAWRDANPNTVQFWRDCNDAAIEATENPGKAVWVRHLSSENAHLVQDHLRRLPAGGEAYVKSHLRHDPGKGVGVAYRKAGSWLFCRLPSGRTLAYAYPKVGLEDMPWNDDSGKPARRPGLRFWSVDSFTKKWSEQRFYGGFAVQNIVQATARDVMRDGMKRIDAAGYNPILTVHDEAIGEAPVGFGSLAEFCSLMAKPSSWMGDLPIAIEGFEAERYRK